MTIVACTAEDIFSLNDKKEYTLTASCLLEHLLTNKNITAQAVKLWQILYNKARFDKHLQVRIRYGYLADKLGVSIRSVHRYIKNLKENCYLFTTHNFGHNGQIENTIIIRAPKALINELSKTKDRNKKTNDSFEENNKTTNGTKKQNPLDSETLSPDKNVAPRSDKAGIPINTIKKDINNNNNMCVVDKSSLNEKLNVQKLNVELVREKLVKVKNDWKNEVKKEYKNKLMQDWCQLEGDYEVHKQRLSLIEADYTTCLIQEEKNNALASDKYLMKNKKGLREVSDFIFQRLDNTLDNIGYHGQNKNRLLNEIIFELRFGSLVKSNQANCENSIEKATNIALKLIRQNRWTTPTII
jgi:hypothetical protein